MLGIIFVNRNNIVDTYQIDVDTHKINNIQKSIDNYSGKGEKKETTCGPDFFVGNSDFFDKKVEILSSKYVGKGQHFDYCCAEVDKVDIYKYKYYAYNQHKLSKLCERLLKSTDSFNLSYCINDILNYKCETGIEQHFLKKIIDSIKFKKINNVNLLIKINNVIKKLNRNSNTELEVNFNKAVEDKIQRMQVINEAFFSRELKGQPLRYSMTEKSKIKKKIIGALPTSIKIN